MTETYQATIPRVAAEIGLGPRGTLAITRNLIGTVGCRGTSANAEDQTAGFDEDRAQRHQLKSAIGSRQGRSQLAVFTAIKLGKEHYARTQAAQCTCGAMDSIRVHAREVTILAAGLCSLTVVDGAKLVAIVARVLR